MRHMDFDQISRIAASPPVSAGPRSTRRTPSSQLRDAQQQRRNAGGTTLGGHHGRNTLFFGFVQTGETQMIEHKLVNHSGEQLRIRCEVKQQQQTSGISGSSASSPEEHQIFKVSASFIW